MLIPIKEYAEFYGLTVARVRQRCLSDRFLTAKKIGRNWFIDKNEKLVDGRKKNSAVTSISHKSLTATAPVPLDYIPLKEYALKYGRVYKSVQQKAIRSGFKTALKIGNQWFINRLEPYKSLK
ncbi:MAG: hypothetical protein RR185_03270 [Angelakisella sp.]